jgi:hypothetical protein
MTDVLDRDADDTLPAPAARLLLAAASAGAGAIHLAMVPSHWDESVVEGVGFAMFGWLQLAFAAVVLVRPSRALLTGGAVVNAAAIATWTWSRTAGLPFGEHSGHAESAGFVDVTCVVFEGVLLVACLALLARPRLAGPTTRSALAFTGTAAVAVLALTTAALASPSARDHASQSHGDHATAGHEHGVETVADDAHHHDDAAAPVDDKGLSLLHNGQHDEHMTIHTLDKNTQKALDAQLAVTRQVAEQTPTVKSALAAGYRRVGPYMPGIGAHFWRPIGAASFGGPTLNPDGVIDDVDLRNPLMLIFDGTKPTSKIAGFMYYSMAGSEPAGFAGRNDYWHFHEQLCLKQKGDTVDVPYGLDHAATQEQCDAVGGWMLKASQYMVHVWSVPGFEMPDEYGGTFGETNPKLTCGDGTYYQLPVEEWAEHPLNVCKVP